MANSYTQGQNIRCTGTFRDVDSGAYVDPGTVIFRALSPLGPVTVYTYTVDPQLVRDSAGHYHADVILNAEGDWWYRFEGAVTHVGAGENRMYARRSRF